jgi:hypothetical protein
MFIHIGTPNKLSGSHCRVHHIRDGRKLRNEASGQVLVSRNATCYRSNKARKYNRVIITVDVHVRHHAGAETVN